MRQQFLASLTAKESLILAHDWRFWARPEQLAPRSNWRVWLILAGRGWGKTRTGAEWIAHQAQRMAGCRLAIVGETMADARAVMVEGESGILACAPPWMRPVFLPSRRLIEWPNGSQAQLFSAEDPEQLRGPQFHAAWCDEVAKWAYPSTWDNLMMGLRLGDRPRVLASTTPRPRPWLKALAEREDTVVTKGSTFDNTALPEAFLQAVCDQYAGTRLGRQELEAEWLEEAAGALWNRDLLSKAVLSGALPPFSRVVVGVDPAVSSTGSGALTGIVVAAKGTDNKYYVLADASLSASPDAWARAVVAAYHLYKADRVIAESNNGGALVRQVLQAVEAALPITLVHAARGKLPRAEPIAALYEQGKVLHAAAFPELEDELCQYTGTGKSPDRMDALVWALSSLMDVGKCREARVRGV